MSMLNKTAGWRWCAIALAWAAASLAIAEPADVFLDLERQFRDPPMEARRLTGPLFWLHGDESPDQLRATLQKVVEGGNGMFVAESRPHNDWLGPGWYRDLDVCVEFARRHNLQMIIFDDYWWPSQMMGGRVPPQYGSKNLVVAAEKVTGPQAISRPGYADEHLISVVAGRITDGDAVDAATLVNLTASVKNGTLAWEAPAGDWQIMKFTWAFAGASGAQRKYISVDGASPECVNWFIQTVYQPHYDRYQDDFGKTIVGFFYDEPETQGDWGSDLPVLAAERGQNLDKLLVGYKFKLAGDAGIAARYEYLDLFAEAWGRTMYGGMARWCRDHGVISMGHFMEHGGDMFRRDMSGGNMMQLQKHSDMGGIDLVCHQVYPGQRNMGVYQMPKIASSISHTYNKTDDIALCEIYGGYDQRLTYPNMKWLADWHHVRGVNLLNTHSFNPRAPYDRDYPPYFYNGGFEPRWPLYRVWADYTNRLATMLTGGHHVCPVAFLHVGQSIHVGKTVRPEEFTSTLQDALFDCDWVLYDAWENHAALKGRGIALHDETYRVLIVPPVEVIPYATLAKARQFFDGGGVVIGYDFLPSQSGTVGKTSADIAALREAIWGDVAAGLKVCRTNAAGGRSYFLSAKPSVGDLRQVLVDDAGVRPTLEVVEGDTGNWLHVLHRVQEGRDLFFVANQHHDGPTKQFRLRAWASGTPEIWDAMRGEPRAVAHQRDPSGFVDFSLTLEPTESALVVFSPVDRKLPRRLEPGRKPLASLEVARTPNPPRLPTAADKPDGGLRGSAWVWHAGDPDNVSACQRFFRGTIEIPSGVEVARATLRITADNHFVLYANGAEIGRGTGGDEGWRRPRDIDLGKCLRAGRNVLAIAAENYQDAPNPAGLIGAWRVQCKDGSELNGRIDTTWKSTAAAGAGWQTPGFDDQTWTAVKPIAPYGAGPWQGFEATNQAFTLPPVTQADPFRGRVEVPSDWLAADRRVCLEVADIPHEDAAAVTINGARAGGFIGKPFCLDVTRYLHSGMNELELAPFAPGKVRLNCYTNEP